MRPAPGRPNIVLMAALVVFVCGRAAAQEPPQHQHDMPMAQGGWTFMQDGMAVGVLNHQGGARGGDEFVAPNWWMGMFSHAAGKGTLTLKTMLSLDPLTVGSDGYRELFQVGESYQGRPLVDRQHPHDFFMQLAAVYSTPLGPTTRLTIAGGPVGEPAIGPVAFMHRASASELPFAPLSHHTFDSTHVAFGVVTAAVTRGRWEAEGSVFNGREPDEHRWDFDFGSMDSVSGRVWFRPTARWAIQVSTAHLVDPEELEPGNIQRTTASASWTHAAERTLSAVTAGYGINATAHGRRHAAFVEGTRRRGTLAVFGRAEWVQVETDILRGAETTVALTNERDLVGAFTAGASVDAGRWKGFDGAAGAEITIYQVPDALRPSHGDHPISFQVFFRVRLPTGGHGRMWDMTMTR